MALRRGSYTVGHVNAPADPRDSKWSPFSWLRRLHELKIEHQFLGRYSVDKLHAFHQYQSTARWWRVAGVLCLTPMPTLVTLIIMDVVPMNDPRAGASHNAVCFVRSVVSHGLMTAVCLLPMRQALRLDESGQYSLYKVALIGLLTCIGIESVWIPTAFLWRFPVPFRELLGVPLWSALVLLLHRYLTPRVFSRRSRRTKLYLVVVSIQIVLFYGFLALSMAFAHVSTLFQVLLMVLFPLVKIAIKRVVWHYARQLDDISLDVTVCMVEISGSLYQTVCLQFATSKAIGLVIMLTDFAQALLEVNAYLATEYIVDGRSTLSTALAILESSVFPGADERPSNANYSSTASAASQHSATRRHSGGGSPNGPAIRRRRRRPQAGSVFVPPKLVKTHTSKRLLDLRRFDFDALDDLGSKTDATETKPPDQDVDDHDDDQGRQTVVDNTLANGHNEDIHVKSTTCKVDVQFDAADVQFDAAEGSADSKPATDARSQLSVSSPEKMLTVSTTTGPRLVVHTDYTVPVNILQKRLSAPTTNSTPDSQLVAKSISGSAPGGGSIARMHSFSQLLRRPSGTIAAQPPCPEALMKSPFHVSFRRASGSMSKVQPDNQAHDASVAPLPPKPTETEAPTTVRHSSPSTQQVTQPTARFHRMTSRDSHQSSHSSARIQRSPSPERHRRRSSGDAMGGTAASEVTIDGVRIVRKDQARILEQTLQLLFSCEVLLFVEYMEVVMPVLYSLCLSAASLLPNAQYNLLTMHMTTSDVVSTLESSLAYAFLELLSLLVLQYVVYRKYGVSSFHLLAFVVETYSMTLQGKLVGAFIILGRHELVAEGTDSVQLPFWGRPLQLTKGGGPGSCGSVFLVGFRLCSRRTSSAALLFTVAVRAITMPLESPPHKRQPWLTRLAGLLLSSLHRLHAWKTQSQYLGRYSVEKLCAFHQYQETTSLWRVALVILMTPLPVFLVLLLIDVVPMNDPRAGPAKNGVAFARSVVGHIILPSAILLSTKQALRLNDRQYSYRNILLIGVGVSVSLEGLMCIPTAFLWHFPVPFREVTFTPFFMLFVGLFNWYFGKDELKRRWGKLKIYLPMVAMQFTMYYTFLSLTGAFTYISVTTQIVLVLGFPAVKLVVKKAVWSKARQLDDLTTDVTICFVELTGALYQTVCLQFAKSQILQYVILFSDFFQALYEVRAYVFHDYITDGVSTVHTAVQIVISGVYNGAVERPAKVKDPGSLRTLVPKFLVNSGVSGSLFLKPKMIKTTQNKRLLDLNQYRYDVDLPELEYANGAATQRALTTARDAEEEAGVPMDDDEEEDEDEEALGASTGSAPASAREADDNDVNNEEATAETQEAPHVPAQATVQDGDESYEPPTAPKTPKGDATGRRTSVDLSPRSVVSHSPSQYDRHHSCAGDSSSYGVSRAETGSVHVSSTALSPAQEASSGDRGGTTSGTTPTTAISRLKPKILPPLRRSSFGNAGADASRANPKRGSDTAFSVYDPLPPEVVGTPMETRSSSIMATLIMATPNQPAQPTQPTQSTTVATKRAGPMIRRKSKRNSTVHPGELDKAVLEADGLETSQATTQPIPSHEVNASVYPGKSTVKPTVSVAGSARSQEVSNGTKDEGSQRRITRVMIDGIQLPRKDQARILEQTLQLLFSCEVLIFVEYLEVLMPSLYDTYHDWILC